MTSGFKNDKEFMRRLAKGVEAMGWAVASGVYAEANNIVAAAKETVPIDLGNLRRSHYATVPDDWKKPSSEFGAGGVTEDYAVRQHEDTSIYHEPNMEGGKPEAKWLQKTMNKAKGDALRNIHAHARAVFPSAKGAPHATSATHPDQEPRVPRSD